MNEDFKYITAIADHGSISKAARAMHISQPAMSQRLRKVEDHLGTELFARGSYPLVPTASGEVFIEYARRAISSENRMRRDIASTAMRRKRGLRVGVPATRSSALLAEAVVEFYESHRGCMLEFCNMSTFGHMHDLFVGDKIDFALLTPMAPDPKIYDIQVLCRENLVVVVSDELKAPQISGLEGKRASIRQFEGMPFILPTCGSYYDPLISKLIDVKDARLDIVVRDCSAEFALALSKQGLGACIMPSTLTIGVDGLRVFELSDVDAGNVLRYIRKRDHESSAEEDTFVEIMRNLIAAR